MENLAALERQEKRFEALEQAARKSGDIAKANEYKSKKNRASEKADKLYEELNK